MLLLLFYCCYLDKFSYSLGWTQTPYVAEDDLEPLLLLLLGIVGVHQHTVYLVLRSTPGPGAWEASTLPPKPRPWGPALEFAMVLRFVGGHASNGVFTLQLEEVLR